MIDPDSGKVSGKDKFVLRLDKAGNLFVHQAGTRTEEIDGDHKVTIKGKQEVEVKGNQDVTVGGNQKTTITANHDISGVQSTEAWSGKKVIGAAQLLLGSQAASEPAVLGLKLVAWLISHTHMVPALPSPSPSAVIPVLPVSGHPSTKPLGDALQATALSKTVKVNQ
jgi:hypothetical protein